MPLNRCLQVYSSYMRMAKLYTSEAGVTFPSLRTYAISLTHALTWSGCQTAQAASNNRRQPVSSPTSACTCNHKSSYSPSSACTCNPKSSYRGMVTSSGW